MESGAKDFKPREMSLESYGGDVVRNMKELRQNDELCDFTVSAEGRTFKVHKILMAATSDYFRAMLQGPMKESKEDKVDLKGLTSHALDLTLNFIYSGQLHLTFDNLMEMLTAASHLQVNAALDLCSDYIISHLTFSNSDDLLHIADMYSLTKVAQVFDAKVLANFADFYKTEQFFRLSSSQLARYLMDDRLVINREHTLFEMVRKWLSHNNMDLSSVEQMGEIEAVMKNIRFALMSSEELMSVRTQLHKDSSVLCYVNDALEYHTRSRSYLPPLSSQTRLRCAQDDALIFVHQGSANRPFEITAFNPDNTKFYQLASDLIGSQDCRVACHDDFVYICRVVDCGGGSLMNSLVRFDLRHLTLHDLTPCRYLRIDPVFLNKNGCLYIFGGTTENYQSLNTVESYSMTGNSWEELPHMPIPAHSMGGVACGELIYLSGGIIGTDRQPVNTLRTYNPVSHVWEEKAPMLSARRLHQMTEFNSRLFVLGGMEAQMFQSAQIAAESYDITTDQWSFLTPTLSGRSLGHYVVLNDRLISVGREHFRATEDDLWAYDSDDDSWTVYATAPHRTGLAQTACCTGHVNFNDENVSQKMIADKP